MDGIVTEITLFIRLLLSLCAFIGIIFGVLWVFIEKRVNNKTALLKHEIEEHSKEYVTTQLKLNSNDLKEEIRKDFDERTEKIVSKIQDYIKEQVESLQKTIEKAEESANARIRRMENQNYNRNTRSRTVNN